MEVIAHESGIKIFKEFIHPEDLSKDFLHDQELSVGDVFLVAGTPYRVEDEFEDGELYASEINVIGLDEWVLNGNAHPKVKWCDTYAIYESEDRNYNRPKLLPYRGKTYFYLSHTGEIFDSVEGECFELSSSSSDSYSGYVGIGSWSDKGYF